MLLEQYKLPYFGVGSIIVSIRKSELGRYICMTLLQTTEQALTMGKPTRRSKSMNVGLIFPVGRIGRYLYRID